jgi:predicted ATP-grasp superfamily ATP-dependent carboligase/CelD/BcsL family acetyltransferase involved in cellulose biosynthesis
VAQEGRASLASPVTPPPPWSTLDPVLLTAADYYGTLAAVRDLDARGVRVALADPRRLSLASWSRHVSTRLRSPSSCDPERLLAWLLAFGERHPGHVLLPTNDDLAWLLSTERERLGRVFKLYSPPATTMATLLDKRRLHEAAAAVGLKTPATWCPADEDEVAALASHLPYPIILKPRTQVYSRMASKGVRVTTPAGLLPSYRAMMAAAAGRATVLGSIPDTQRPMLQAYLTGGGDQIYELSGFIDEGGEGFVARAAMKVVQRPRRMGIGLCFEEAPLDHALAEQTARLCRQVGFHGIFNVEFLVSDGGLFLIDFNPRMYNQMAFDVARGLPLPWLAYLAACGRREELGAAIEQARAWQGPPRVFCNRFSAALLLNAQVLAGAIPASELDHWYRWYSANKALAVDPVADRHDWVPLALDVGHQLLDTARHARHFVRQLRLDGGVVPIPAPSGPAGVVASVDPLAGAEPSVTAYRTLEEARPFGPALDALNLRSRRPSPFETMEYLETFQRHDEHAAAGQATLLLVLRDAGQEIGWVALRLLRERVLGLSSTRVTFLATHDVDRPGLVCRPADEARCADAVWRHLLEQEGVDAIELMSQDKRSFLLPAGRALPGWRVRTFDSIPNSTIALPPGTLGDWFRSLGKKHRTNVGRLGRRLLAAGQVELLTARHPEALGPFLDLYLDVERRSWKGPAGAGIGRHPQKVELFRDQCQAGRAVEPVIHLVAVDGVPVAAMFGVEFAGGVYAREIAFDEHYADLAPGHLLMLLAIGDAIARRRTFVNLLGFFGYYKTRWGAVVTPTRGVQLLRRWSPPWVAAWGRALGRRLRPGAPASPEEAFNPARRESEEVEDRAVAGRPEGQAERALLRDALQRLPADRVARLSGGALEAALPFRVAEPGAGGRACAS